MSMSKPQRVLLMVIAAIAVCGFVIWLITKPSTPQKVGHLNKGLVVKVEQASIQSMPVYINEVGTVAAAETASIIPQVTGTLKKIDFQGGQNVIAGQLLFEIDPATYESAVRQAEAILHRDEAQLNTLKADEIRYGNLVKMEYVTQQQYEQAVAAAKAQAAVVASDQAAVDQAKIQLSHTKIHAPIAGKTSSVVPNPGELVTANSAALVVINRMDPMMVVFNVPQSQLPQVLSAQQKAPLQVEVASEESAAPLATGKLVFINNSVNLQTGTVQMKAEVPNTKQLLWPGQLVTVRVVLKVEPHAVVIPSKAVQLDQEGTYVFLVKDGKAVVQRITVDRQVGKESVVSKGLQGNETVITEIPPGLSNGASIEVFSPSSTAGASQKAIH